MMTAPAGATISRTARIAARGYERPPLRLHHLTAPLRRLAPGFSTLARTMCGPPASTEMPASPPPPLPGRTPRTMQPSGRPGNQPVKRITIRIYPKSQAAFRRWIRIDVRRAALYKRHRAKRLH